MTVRDLLTMRTGLDWSEQVYAGSPLEALNTSTSDWLRFVLDGPMRELPGTRWEYNSGGVILLGGAIGLAARVNEADYVREHLFHPIGITGDKWGAASRICFLTAAAGSPWIRESTRLSVAHPRTFNQHAVDYGYLWWLLPIDGSGGRERTRDEIIITAAGACGQWLFVVPRW